MDWQHFKDDVFNGLVSGVTVLLVLGTGGKAVFEHWFNKRLKAYEAELKSKNDEAQTKLDYRHPEQAKAVMVLQGMCIEISKQLIIFEVYWNVDKGKTPYHYGKELVDCHLQVQGKLFDIEEYTIDQHHYLDPQLLKSVEAFSESVTQVFASTIDENVQSSLLNAKADMSSIEMHVKSFLGISDNGKGLSV